MLFAEFIDVVESYSVIIGIGIALLFVVAIPPLRRSLLRAFEEGKKDGERWQKRRKTKENDEDASA